MATEVICQLHVIHSVVCVMLIDYLAIWCYLHVKTVFKSLFVLHFKCQLSVHAGSNFYYLPHSTPTAA